MNIARFKTNQIYDFPVEHIEKYSVCWENLFKFNVIIIIFDVHMYISRLPDPSTPHTKKNFELNRQIISFSLPITGIL